MALILAYRSLFSKLYEASDLESLALILCQRPKSAPASLGDNSARHSAHWAPLSTCDPKVRVKNGARVAESQISAAAKVQIL